MRDFTGYKNDFPEFYWPAKARIAVSFVVNFEEGAEFSVRDGDSVNESIYEVIDNKKLADPCIDSHFEYGTRVAYWRIDELFEKFGASYTLSACGRAVERSPWLARHASERGHELSGHGWRWQSGAGLTREAELESILKTSNAIFNATGRRPVGWHTRSAPSQNTRSLLLENGFIYDSDAYNDDTPYYSKVGSAPHLVLPYAFDTNDMQFQNNQRFSTADEFVDYVCSAFDWLWKEGEHCPRMLSIGLHLRMIGRPGRIAALEKILMHISNKGGAWIATREQIARHWLEVVPPPHYFDLAAEKDKK